MAQPDETARVQAIMLQEAQEEIGKLRAELYSTRRVAEERRQALEVVTNARDQLAAAAQQMEQQLAGMQGQVMQLRQLQQQHQELQELHDKMKRDNQLHLQARRILEEELRDERQSRSTAEEARGAAEAERSRLQRARDDLAAQLRVSQQKAAEAEEEQCRAEEELVALRSELATLQQRAQEGAGAQGQEDMSAAAAAGTSQGLGGADTAGLRQALDAERNRAAALLAQANEAAAAAARARAEADGAKKQLAGVQAELQQQQARSSSLTAEVSALQAQLATSSMSSSKGKQEEAKPAADGKPAGQGEVVELWQQLQQLQAAHSRLQDDNRQLQQQMRRAELQVQQLQQNNRQLAAAASSRGAQATANSSAAAAGAQVEELEVEIGSLHDQVELLMGKVVVLKKSRDKLLAVLDSQSMELEQLANENQALSDEVAAAKQQAGLWQSQVQEGLSTISKLQDCMEESANWSAAAAGPAAADAGANMQGQLLKEQARRAQLELQVQALCAELLRVHGAQREVGRCLVPLLGGVEGRLLTLRHAAAAVKLR